MYMSAAFCSCSKLRPRNLVLNANPVRELTWIDLYLTISVTCRHHRLTCLFRFNVADHLDEHSCWAALNEDASSLLLAPF